MNNRITTNDNELTRIAAAKPRLLYPDLSYYVQGCFFTVYNTLGFGHKEVVYCRALHEEFMKQNLPFSSQPKIPIMYEEKKIAVYQPDFIIDDKIIIEVKALEFLPRKMLTQLIYYLKGTNYQLGYLVNFGSPKLQIWRRIWTPNYKKTI